MSKGETCPDCGKPLDSFEHAKLLAKRQGGHEPKPEPEPEPDAPPEEEAGDLRAEDSKETSAVMIPDAPASPEPAPAPKRTRKAK